MLNPAQKKRYEKQFSTIESSFRVEGMDPIHDEAYRHAKAQVLRGTMTPEQALTFIVEQSQELAQPASSVR